MTLTAAELNHRLKLDGSNCGHRRVFEGGVVRSSP